MVVIILYPASRSRIIVIIIKNSGINNSSMLILFWSKTAFVCHFFPELQKHFQLTLLVMLSLTILCTAGVGPDSLCLASQ